MININNVTLVGRLTKDIELKKTQSNKSYVQFTLAVGRRFKNEGGPEADFINCVAWNQVAEFLGKYAMKGNICSVEGRIQTRSYEKDGNKTYITEVLSEKVSLISPKPEGKEEKKSTDVAVNDNQVTFDPDDLPFY